MTDKKKTENDPRRQVIQEQLIDFAHKVRRAVAGEYATIIVTFEDNTAQIGIAEFAPGENDIWRFIQPLLSLAQLTFDVAEVPAEIIVRMPDGTERKGWSSEVGIKVNVHLGDWYQ